MTDAQDDDHRVVQLVTRAAGVGASVGADAAARLLDYLDAMLARNRAHNLTAIRDPAAAEVLHALDSLAVGALRLSRPTRALDLGSGNGFPGVALAVLWPQLPVTLLERTAKKARALGDLAATVGLEHVDIAHVDAAQVPALRPDLDSAYDLITARAVAEPGAVARLAQPMLAPGGTLLLWLEADARPQPQLRGGLRRERHHRYALPEPAPRRRQLVSYIAR
ncbi:MAG: 16S rRNA (guanine(527)-N(7))-methyltransferase RsmG [Planctomycetota bacterium]